MRCRLPPDRLGSALMEALRTCASDLTGQERALVSKVWREGERLYRDLPWRNTRDPYAIMLSEIMLQQTQVSRVQKYWGRFLDLFPTADALASAETSLVLEMWQGLGYNRRALALKSCAEACSQRYGGALPRSREELVALPGIGPATAGGICAFAYNEPGLYLETNVRTVFLHELFPERQQVPDKEIAPFVERTCSLDNPRGWYYALLDYGSYLKSTLPNPSRRSKHHSRQSAFEGSRRQKRAELVRVVLAQREVSLEGLHGALAEFEAAHGRPEPELELTGSIADDLVKEGFFAKDGERYCAK